MVPCVTTAELAKARNAVEVAEKKKELEKKAYTKRGDRSQEEEVMFPPPHSVRYNIDVLRANMHKYSVSSGRTHNCKYVAYLAPNTYHPRSYWQAGDSMQKHARQRGDKGDMQRGITKGDYRR